MTTLVRKGSPRNHSPAFGEWMTDRQIDMSIKQWNIIICSRCGKKISMLTAKHDKDANHFYCAKGCIH
jgi:hypothetical protein